MNNNVARGVVYGLLRVAHTADQLDTRDTCNGGIAPSDLRYAANVIIDQTDGLDVDVDVQLQRNLHGRANELVLFVRNCPVCCIDIKHNLLQLERGLPWTI